MLSALALTWHFQEQQRNCPVLPSIPVNFSPLLAFRHLEILQAHPGSWQPQELCSLSGWVRGGLQVTGAVPQLGRKMNDLHNSCPSMQHPGRVCSSPAADAAPQLCWSQRGGSQGVVSPQDTEGQSSLCFSSPVQGPACPARTRTSFPELRHSLELSPSTSRASPGTAGGDLPCSEPPRVCRHQAKRVEGLSEVTRVTIQLSPCPGQLLRQGAFLLRAQPL